MDYLPDIDRDAGAVHQQIAAGLRTAIESGRLGPGARVPGENELMKRYGVARVTARDALGLLRNAGLIETVPKVGTFVRTFQPIYRYGSQRLKRERWSSGKSIQNAELDGRPQRVDMIEVVEIEADGRLAELLELDADAPVIVRRRRYCVEDKPVQTAASYLPASVARGTAIAEANPGPGGIYARLAELGHEPTRWVEELCVRMPTPAESKTLNLPAGTPVVHVTRVAYTAKDAPVEVNDMTFDATAYVFIYDLPGDH